MTLGHALGYRRPAPCLRLFLPLTETLQASSLPSLIKDTHLKAHARSY